MNVTSYITKEYENKSNWAICENEPNSNPNKPNLSKCLSAISVTGQTAHLLMDRMYPKLLSFRIKNSLTGLCNSVEYLVLYCERDFL
jgi:hypothetical protein